MKELCRDHSTVAIRAIGKTFKGGKGFSPTWEGKGKKGEEEKQERDEGKKGLSVGVHAISSLVGVLKETRGLRTRIFYSPGVFFSWERLFGKGRIWFHHICGPGNALFHSK